MSVGISQVNFDAQVLEDEEEAALEKEDKEREQEIRELLNSELDDCLLDDDNASFSSHDLRSSGYSRDTPFSEDFTEHQNVTEQGTKTFLPSEGGAFERPPLITQRAFQFMNGSGQNRNSHEGVANLPHDYDLDHHYEQSYNQQGVYEYRDQENCFDDQVHRYKQNYNGHDEGDVNYQISPDDVDEGFSLHENFHPDEATNGQLPYQQESHHKYTQPHYTSGNFNECDNGSEGQQFDEDYGGYFDRGLLMNNGYKPHITGGGSINEQNSNSLDAHPVNYQVQYRSERQPYQHAIGKGPECYSSETHVVSNGGIQDNTQDAQLQILYKARGRKIEELARKLESQEEERTKEIRVLNHQNALIKDERDGLSTSLEQSQKMVQTCSAELNKLKGQLAAAYQQINALQGSKEEVVSKLHVAETTIGSLNQQLMELSRSESLTRAKEQHESIVNAMRKKHEEQILALKQKLDEEVLSKDYRYEEANKLRDELVEKADMINSLTKSLDASQKQCQELLKSGTMTEINQLRIALQETSTARNVAEGECISLKHELTELKEQVKMYERASRLGVGVGGSILNSNSVDHLTVRNLNKENWGTPKAPILPVEETVSGLRKELEQCLISNKAKREQVQSLEKELTSVKSQLKEQQTKAHRMEMIAQEHEVKSQELERKIQIMENEKKDPDIDHRRALEDLEVTRRNLQVSDSQLDQALKQKEGLEQTCAELKQQMAQMVAEYDEDKRASIEKCREACLQLHEDAKNLLKHQLNQEHEEIVRALKKELEDNGEELIRIKECYVQLSEESRVLEQRLKEEFDKEKDALLAENETKLRRELLSGIQQQHTEQLIKEREQSREEEAKRIEDEVMKEKEKLLKDLEAENARLTEEAIAKARKEWQDERPSDFDDQLASAKKEWLKNHNDDLEKRLSNTIEEVRRIWDEEQKQKTKEEIDKVRAEMEKVYKESRDHHINQAVELALSHAHADWLKNDEMRQREIDQAVEVATTNAVAEAKEEWEREIKSQDNLLQAALAQERRRWHKEVELERNKAAEAAVAVAEVKWLEEEERKISEAIEQALQVARDSWQDEKAKNIAAALEKAQQEWNSKRKEEVDSSLESTSSQLVKQFEKQTKEAVEKAVGDARLQWERHLSDQKRSETESLREQIFNEFEEQKKVEIMETLEEAKEAWVEEAEEQKREEVNEAVAYLEAEYAKSLDEFKSKELKETLDRAREQWTAEELSHREEIVEARLSAAREDWRREMAHSTQVEIERALSTAKEAWSLSHKEELDNRANQVEKSLREKLQTKHDEEKRQLVDDALNEAQAKFRAEKRKLEDELSQRKAEESSHSLWKEEKTQLVQKHQNQMERLRSEHESKLKEQRAQMERDLINRMQSELQKARNGWDKEQQLARVQLESQYEQKTRQALEKAKLQWKEHHRQETSRQCEDAIKRQQEMWTNERRENRSSLERVTRELAMMKKEYGMIIEKLKRELAEERKKLQHQFHRQRSKTHTDQTTSQPDSGSDLSFSSVDNVSAMRGLEELRGHYLDTIAKIRNDVLDHINQTKASAAKKIRSEVSKERHSTAKKLRKYYLQCLKQLLEEDRIALESNTSPSSTEDKLNRMAEALRTFSPDKESSGQSSHRSDAIDSAQRPCSGVLRVLRTSSESVFPAIASPSALRTPRDSGPDGASDTGPLIAKERVFSPVLGQRLNSATGDNLNYDPSKEDNFIPEKDLGGSVSEKTELISSEEIPAETKAYHVSSPVLKGAVVRGNTQEESETVAISSLDREKCDVTYCLPEHLRKQKPPPSYKRSAPSPAFSVKSYESDQYSELPTVIHLPRKESSGSKESYERISDPTAVDPVTHAPRSDMRGRLSSVNKITRPESTRVKKDNSSPVLPSKPRMDVKLKRTAKT